MIIKDIEGLYEINVDIMRGIVYQTHNKEEMFTVEALRRMDKDYKEKVIPRLGRKWAKCCDLRNYKIGNNVEEMTEHNQYCIANGMSDVALIVESDLVKMQMNRAGRKVKFAPTAFTQDREAERWLKSKGY